MAEDNATKESLLMMLFLFSFFFVWNIGISARTLAAVVSIYYGNVFQGMIDLFCPLWIVGIIAPLWIGYEQSGLVAFAVAGIVCVILPYGISIFRLLVYGAGLDEEDLSSATAQGRGGGCLGRLLLAGHRRSQQHQQHSNDNPPEEPVDHRELLVIKTAKSRDSDDATAELTTCGSATPAKADDVMLPSGEMCSICLEGYKDGEAVAWSKSPNCQHAFHASCLNEWLSMKNKAWQVCPVCRESYHSQGTPDFSGQLSSLVNAGLGISPASLRSPSVEEMVETLELGESPDSSLVSSRTEEEEEATSPLSQAPAVGVSGVPSDDLELGESSVQLTARIDVDEEQTTDESFGSLHSV